MVGSAPQGLSCLNVWCSILDAAGGAGVVLGVLQLTTWARARRDLGRLLNGLFAFASAGFCFLGAVLRQTADPAAHLEVMRWWIAAGTTSAVLWPWVVRAFARIADWRFAFLGSALYLVDIPLDLWLPKTVAFETIGPVLPVRVPGLGVVEYQMTGEPPPWAPLLGIAPLCLCAFGYYAAHQLLKRGEKTRALALVAATTIELGTTLRDVFSVATGFRTPYVSDFGFIVFALILAVVIANELWDDARLKAIVAASENRLRSTFEAMTEAVFVLGHDGRIIDGNPAASKLAQHPLAAMMGQSLEDVVGLSTDEEAHSRVIERSDGSRRSIVRTVGRTGDDTVVVLRDVTEHELLEERLRRKQQMESLGELAGGIAHDFNNLLTGIGGAVELLREGVVDDTNEVMDILESTVQRARTLTRGLLTFSRGGHERAQVVSAGSLVQDVVALLKQTLAANIVVDVRLLATSDLIEGPPVELHSALLNLAVNARDAMQSGGVLTFTTRETQRSAEGPNRFGFRLAAGHYVVVEVEDTGSGMSPEVLDQIFTPFFTTKPLGVGTGLGLATVWGTLQQIRGSLEVTSEAGRGTRFVLFFPAAAAGAFANRTEESETALDPRAKRRSISQRCESAHSR